MKKKLISLLLILIFVAQSLPLGVLAETANPAPTAADLTSWIALTGLSKDAAGFHPGMDASRNMNALQMSEWIEDYEEESLFYLTDIFEDYDVAMHEQQNLFSDAGFASQIDLFYSCYDKVMDHRDEVSYYHDSIVKTAGDVFTMAEALHTGSLSEKEKLVYSYQVREAANTLEDLMSEVCERAPKWSQGFEPWASEQEHEALLTLFEAVDAAEGISVSGTVPWKMMSVATSAVRVAPDPMTISRLSRLAPVTSALADEDQLMKVMVIDDKYFVVHVKADGNALEGVEVQAGGKGTNSQTRTTDANGYATFAVRDFKVGNDGIVRFDVTLKKNGYQTVHCPGLWVKKGGRQNLEMKKDVGTPYPVAWTFWGNDMLKNRYTVVTSPFNETNQRIALTLHSDRDYTVKMVFRDRNGKEVMQVGSGSGKAGEQTFQYDARYLQKVPAESKLVAEVTSDGKTEVFEAQLWLEAAKVTNPIGDPDTKFLTIPGLQFKLPNSWPAPLKGLVVAINLDPPDAVKVRLFVDLNGNGAITLGTSAFDDVIKEINNGLWKTQDKRTMDEAVRAAEERGRMAKAKAANGGDWAGRSRWNPFKLGNIALEMSMFGFAQVQYRSTNDKHGEITGKGGAGVVVGVGGEAGLQWPFFSITLGAKAAVTVFAEVGVRMHTYWPSNQKLPSLSRFEYIKGSLNYIIRLELSLTFAVGLKGVLSASIGGLGFLEIQIRASLGAGTMDEWLKKGSSVGTGSDSTLKVIGGASFMIIVEVLWFKTTYYPFTPESGAWKWQLYPEVKRLAETGPMTMTERFIDWFLASASAEEKPEGGLSVDTANRDLELHKKAELVEEGIVQSDHLDVFEMEVTQSAAASRQKANVMLQLRNAGGGNHPVLMYAIVGEENNKKLDFKRLERRDLYGPEQGYDVIDYAYWVQNVGQSERAFLWETGVPVQQLLFTVSILAKEYEDVEIIREGETVKTRLPVKTWASVNCYVLGEADSVGSSPEFSLFREAGLQEDAKTYKGYPELSVTFELGEDGNPNGNPVIFGRLRTKEDGNPLSSLVSPNVFDIHLITSPLRVDRENGGSGKALHTTLRRNVDAESTTTNRKVSEDPVNNLLKPDLIVSQNRFFPTGSEPLAEPARIALFHLKGETSKLQKMAYIPQPGTAPVQIADRVLSMAVTEENRTHQVFYVEESPDKQGYNLKSASITPDTPNKVIITDYDVKMPAADIEYTRLFNRGCIYWTEKTGTEQQAGNIFVVRGLWVDSDESISVPFDLARVEIPENEGILSNLYLDDHNTGFYSVQSEQAGKNTLTIYRFTFKLTLGLNLVGNVLQSTLATPGSYDDMVVTYYNNGNVPLTGMDLTAYRKLSNGKAEPFETIHLDILDPKQNKITLKKGFLGAATEERKGEEVARWEESSLGNGLNHYRNLIRSSYTVSGNSIRKDENGQQQKLMKPRMLMPTAYGAHIISLLIPQGWSGSQEIYLKVERLYTTDGISYLKDVTSNQVVTGEKVISVGLRNQTLDTKDNPPVENKTVIRVDGEEQAEETEYWEMFETEITYDTVILYTEPEDLELMTTLWEDEGTQKVTISVNNRKNWPEGTTPRIEAYIDEEERPTFRYELPEKVIDKRTWNLDVPISLLTGGKKATQVTIRVIGDETADENGEFDNWTTIQLEADTMMIVLQPDDQIVPISGNAVFNVALEGGRKPYFYRWQVKVPGGEWVDLEDQFESTLTLTGVTLAMNGNLYRCLVGDAGGYEMASREALLTVFEVPKTGDNAPVIRWLAVAAAALAGLCWLCLRKRKEETT